MITSAFERSIQYCLLNYKFTLQSFLCNSAADCFDKIISNSINCKVHHHIPRRSFKETDSSVFMSNKKTKYWCI